MFGSLKTVLIALTCLISLTKSIGHGQRQSAGHRQYIKTTAL